MTNKQIEILARKAEREGQNDLAIILHVYLGSKHAGMGSLFAEHCQDFARSGLKAIDQHKNIRNN